ncbi:MAG TPA: 23S rRNA (pseudouridine(1915)-N(3))-methyltransferase RlmH [Bdellovibrionales bacterium]|nr:MAG: hypothetical protein A2Z97_05540 [Bdellovibrionales bacterium GWB1_52_6]OFZ05731.1 MAG: hypothetical protein A2X97_03445 [Bdellovibrionales bacterium GWA1_52_35]HAR42585.1 23S rRNA (pseudouridine(1915)-N(3))-methyltransferase RlmH [Bdellovibrionales bacterium]HCM40329.1 23S rRNA (pseudouridine(1915)-N(3))-methyltransferase RlmH [Bdellovibrionales bacterium]
MRLAVLAFGKLKTPGLREAADYYLRLSKGYCSVDEQELKPVFVPEKSPAIRKQIQKKELDLIRKSLHSQGGSRNLLYLLDEGGKSLRTEEWAELIRAWERDGIQNVTFCIGSSLGFADELRSDAKGRILSLGTQTLPHELARVVLLEQLYRALSVTRGHPYHNEGSS